MRGKKAKLIRKIARTIVQQYADKNEKTFDEVATNVVNQEWKKNTSFNTPVFGIDGKQIGEKVFTGNIAYASGMKVAVKNLLKAYKNAAKARL